MQMVLLLDDIGSVTTAGLVFSSLLLLLITLLFYSFFKDKIKFTLLKIIACILAVFMLLFLLMNLFFYLIGNS